MQLIDVLGNVYHMFGNIVSESYDLELTYADSIKVIVTIRTFRTIEPSSKELFIFRYQVSTVLHRRTWTVSAAIFVNLTIIA